MALQHAEKLFLIFSTFDFFLKISISYLGPKSETENRHLMTKSLSKSKLLPVFISSTNLGKSMAESLQFNFSIENIKSDFDNLVPSRFIRTNTSRISAMLFLSFEVGDLFYSSTEKCRIWGLFCKLSFKSFIFFLSKYFSLLSRFNFSPNSFAKSSISL